jgi:hypothetical protein
MFGNIFEMAVTIPIAVITLALHPHVCFAAVAMSAVSDTKKKVTFLFILLYCSRSLLRYQVIRLHVL